MMQKTRVLGFCVVMLFAARLAGAQDAPSLEGIEPEEPVLILPDVVIQVADEQQEEVVGDLPAEEALSARESEVPLPEADLVLAIEPVLALPAATRSEYREAPFYAEVEIGVGTTRHLLSDVALYKIGEKPRFRVGLRHQQMESFSLPPSDEPYSFREEKFEVDCSFGLSGFEGEFFGDYWQQERGLQGEGMYAGRTGQRLQGEAGLERVWAELFGLAFSARGGYASSLLESADPLRERELFVIPAVSSEFIFGGFRIGADAEYVFNLLELYELAPALLHRLEAGLYMRWDFPSGVSLAGDVDYYWNSLYGLANPSYYGLVPFRLAVSGNVARAWDYRLAGGFRAQPLFLSGYIFGYPYAYVADDPPGDDAGWFVDASSVLHIGKHWTANAGLAFQDHSRLLHPAESADAETGLFPIVASAERCPELRFETGVQGTWNGRVNLSGRWMVQLLALPENVDSDRLAITVGLTGEKRRAEVETTFKWDNILSEGLSVPDLGLEASVQLGSAVSLGLQGRDLLHLLASEPRYAREPFVEPGSRLSAALDIRL